MDCSTIDPTVSQDMAGLADKRGAMFVDAPVSGGTLSIPMLNISLKLLTKTIVCMLYRVT